MQGAEVVLLQPPKIPAKPLISISVRIARYGGWRLPSTVVVDSATARPHALSASRQMG